MSCRTKTPAQNTLYPLDFLENSYSPFKTSFRPHCLWEAILDMRTPQALPSDGCAAALAHPVPRFLPPPPRSMPRGSSAQQAPHRGAGTELMLSEGLA